MGCWITTGSGKPVGVGGECWGVESHSQVLVSLLDLGELGAALVCGNPNHRVDQELAIIWKCPVHTQPHL